MSRLWEALKQHGRALTTEITALYWAYRDPRTPWYARAWVVLVVAYALSPVDLIPDFVPILGYVDDLLLLPLGIWLALRLIPKPVIEDARIRAQQAPLGPAVQRWQGAVLVMAVWALVVVLAVLLVRRP
jgi:uncharacterized membrane protein YkvA (DUF1232 family)